MNRLRAMTERDRLGDVVAAIENGEPVDYGKVRQLQTLDVARAGRAALLDALDREDEADADLKRICGGG